MERLVQFTFMGKKYKVYTGTSDEDMEKILALMHHAEGEIVGDGGRVLSAGKTAVMVSLSISSKYLRLQQEYEQYRAEVEKRIGCLNDQIDTDLLQENSR